MVILTYWTLGRRVMHGAEPIIQALVIAAASVGLIGGITAGATDSHPGAGLCYTIAIGMALALGYLAWAAPGEFFAGLTFALIIIAIAGVIPLSIVFFVAFGLSMALRERLAKKAQRSEPAP